MQQSIERLAVLSIARACGFAGLGIFTMMIGLSWQPSLAIQAGGIMLLLTCAVLLLKALNARTRPYKLTEVWILLPERERPAAVVAQHVIGEALRAVYLRFALHAGMLGGIMESVGLALQIMSKGTY